MPTVGVGDESRPDRDGSEPPRGPLVDADQPTVGQARWIPPTEGGGLVRPGQLVDQFKVLRLLGRGGAGEVYLARDTVLGRKVALKVLRPEALGSAEVAERFLREARTTARFAHPHIVAIHAVGRFEGHPYVALEYLEGQTLRERLREGLPGVVETVRVGLAVADALSEAHGRKILHRDLKPENVMIPRDGRIRVLDFGLAKRVPAADGGDPDAADATTSVDLAGASLGGLDDPFETGGGGLRGTPAYMAPEQWSPEAPLTPAIDVWALGLLLCEMLTGRRPYADMPVMALAFRLTDDQPVPLPPRPADVPDPLWDLLRRCLAKDPARRPAAAEAAEVLTSLLERRRRRHVEETNPYRGLLPFTERHADLFFGRDADIASFIERMRDEPVMPVVGPSGAGKSSFVGAGVIPRLREQGRWLVIQLRPGRQPFDALAAHLVRGDGSGHGTSWQGHGSPAPRPRSLQQLPDAPWPRDAADLAAELRRSPPMLGLRLHQLADAEDTRVLLFIDQGEELFTLVDRDAERAAFMDAVCGAVDDYRSPVRVVLTIRDDFLVRLAESVPARQALGHITVLRTPGPDELRQIVLRPLELSGHTLEDPRLVDEMVAAVADEPASLPLLQFTCAKLWEQRDRGARRIPRAAYEAIGGVEGALAWHADGVLEGLTPGQLGVARQLLLRLVTAEGTRKVEARSRVLDGLGPDGAEVLDRLVRHRIVLARRGRARRRGGGGEREAEVELVHESLIRNWGRLRRWIEESRDELAFLAEVEQAAQLWRRRGRPLDEVWSGTALAEALGRARRCGSVPRGAREFLDAGRARDAARRRRRRAVVGAVIVLLAAVALVLAVKEREASRERDTAVDRRAEALREGARAALAQGDPFEARAKLRGALELRDAPLARALWYRLSETPLVWQAQLGFPVYRVDVSPDGRLVAAACSNHTIQVIDASTRRVRVLRGHTAQVVAVDFTPDSTALAATTWSGDVWLWSLDDGSHRDLGRHAGAVDAVAVSPDGALLATAGEGGTLRLWDLPGGSPAAVIDCDADVGADVTFSPDGAVVAVIADGRRVLRYTVGSWIPLPPLPTARTVHSLAFSPDGARLLAAGSDGTVEIFDVGGGGPSTLVQGPDHQTNAAALSPDGALLATATYEGLISLWRVADGTRVRRLEGHTDQVWSVAFAPDGHTLASGGIDGRTMLWDLTTPSTRPPQRGHGGSVDGVGFSPDGRTVASCSYDRTVRLWDVATGAQRAVLRGPEGYLEPLDWSPDGRWIAAGGSDTRIWMWDALAGGAARRLDGHDAALRGLAFSPDGTTLASSCEDGTAALWDVATGRRLLEIHAHAEDATDIRWTRDGGAVATGGGDNAVRLWDAATGARLMEARCDAHCSWSVDTTPDGRELVGGGTEGVLRLWDAASATPRELARFSSRIGWLAVHPQGRLVGVPLGDGTARLLDLDTGDQRVLRGHAQETNTLRFSPDGRLAVTGAIDGTVRLWDVATGRPVWRAPLLLADPPRLLTHRGWIDPSTGLETPRGGDERWRQAVEDEARLARVATGGEVLCMATLGEDLVVWDTAADRELRRDPVPDLRDVEARADGCLSLDGRGTLRLHPRAGAPRVLAEDVSAAGVGRGAVLAASGTRRQVTLLDPDGGAPARRLPADEGVTAVALLDGAVAVGFKDGDVALLPLDEEAPPVAFAFEDVPAAAVTRMVAGPMHTLVAGFADGEIGIWSLGDGRRMDHFQLHGPVLHLALHGTALLVATDLGDHAAIDLGVFYRPRCELLREVWDRVAVEWEEGRPVPRPPPADHACRAP